MASVQEQRTCGPEPLLEEEQPRSASESSPNSNKVKPLNFPIKSLNFPSVFCFVLSFVLIQKKILLNEWLLIPKKTKNYNLT